MGKKNETQEQSNMIEIAFSRDPHPQGIVFRMGEKDSLACFSPYTWLTFCDHEVTARTLKLDFSRYDVVLRAADNHSLSHLFAAIAKNECSEVAEKQGTLTIEAILGSPQARISRHLGYLRRNEMVRSPDSRVGSFILCRKKGLSFWKPNCVVCKIVFAK
jgi:hypothetical protein